MYVCANENIHARQIDNVFMCNLLLYILASTFVCMYLCVNKVLVSCMRINKYIYVCTMYKQMYIFMLNSVNAWN